MAARDRGLSSYERLRRIQSVTHAALGYVSIDELLNELLVRGSR